MNDVVAINIGKQFSRFPSGRTPDDSAYSGEAFRDKFLLEPLSAGKSIEIFLDDAVAYGSSFLDEAFGGLVRVGGFSMKFLQQHLALSSFDEALMQEIWDYIRENDQSK